MFDVTIKIETGTTKNTERYFDQTDTEVEALRQRARETAPRGSVLTIKVWERIN